MAVPLTGLEELKLSSVRESLATTKFKQSFKIRSVATTAAAKDSKSAATKDSRSPEDILLSAATKDSAATKNLRIASWNVNGLTTKSEARVEIIKHVAEAIKLYKFDIVALQEIPSSDAMSELREALNIKEKDRPQQSWKCRSQEDNAKKLGFVWNSGIIEIEVHDLPFDYFARRPYHLKFKFEGRTINLVNLHLTSRGNGQAKRKIEISKKINNDKEQDKLIDLVHNVCPIDQPSPYVFLIGDFNCFPWSKGLEMKNYVNLLPLRKYTNTKQDECYDNIIVPDKIKCDRNVITADNLKRLSDHFPIWAEFSF